MKLSVSFFKKVMLVSLHGVYISQLIPIVRGSNYVADFNTRNKLLTQKFALQGYQYYKLPQTFF